jgi:hypothetical protein
VLGTAFPVQECSVLGCPVTDVNAALRALKVLRAPWVFMLAPADPGYRLLPTPRIAC